MLSLDIRGSRLENAIPSEIHHLGGGVRAVPLNHGVYHIDSLQIYSIALGRKLVKGVDYKPVVLCFDLIKKFGVGLAYGLDFKEVHIDFDIVVSYRALGGYEGKGVSAYVEMLEMVNRVRAAGISWNNINHPTTFTPFEHSHYFKDIRDYEELSTALYAVLMSVQLNNRLGYTASRLSQNDVRLLSLLYQMTVRLNRIPDVKGFTETIEATQEDVDALTETITELQEILVDLAVDIVTSGERLDMLELNLYNLLNMLSDMYNFSVIENYENDIV